ncbi:phage tail tape measure protein (plasmid) [Pantoea agglomerans]|uniref:phage tail tape measure protein n=1 Tax=Enterobacter agglomerans TaxID=549 RepID=UPI001F287B05|nr:phage tail tape measure protein [Pantoea agglomerans]UIL54740.1 phage tail tape measure protein [Pantoea agglomerans]
MASKSLGTLTIDLIAKVGGFVSGMSQAERSSQQWRKKVEGDVKAVSAGLAAVSAAALAAGAAGFALLKSTAEQVNSTDQWAKSLKMSTQELLAWQFAAEKAGVAGDNMADIFKDLSDKIGDAILNKSGEAVDALNALGLSAEKLSKVSPDKQMLAIGEALGKISTNAGKVTILESLGNDLSKLLPLFDNNNAKLNQFIQLAKDYGVAPDPQSIDDLIKVNNLFQDMEAQVKGLKMEIAAGLAKVDLGPLQNSISDIHKTLTDPQILQGLVNLVQGVAELTGWLVKAAAAGGDLAAKFAKPLVASMGIGDSTDETVIKNRIEYLNKAREYSDSWVTALDRSLGKMPTTAEIDKETSALTDRLKKVQENKKAQQELFVQASKAGSAIGLAIPSFSLSPGETNSKPPATKKDTSAAKMESAFRATERSYMRQIEFIDTTGKKTAVVTEQQKLQFDIADGKLQGLNATQQKRLESLAKEVDRLNAVKKANEENARVATFVANLQAQNSNAKSSLNIDVQGAGVGDKERHRMKERLNIEREYLDQQRELQTQYQSGDITKSLYDRETSAISSAMSDRLKMQEDYYKSMDAMQSDWMGGVSDGLANWLDTSSNYSASAANVVSSSMDSALDNVSSMLMGNKASWKDWASSVLSMIAKVALQMAAVNLVSGIVSSVGGAAVGAASAGGGTANNSFSGGAYNNLTLNAKGGVYESHDLSQYSGSVVSSPTLFAFAKGAGLMGEAGPEAIMPLTRAADGSLGVRAIGSGGGSGGTSISVSAPVTVEGGGAGETGSANTANTARQLQSMIQTVISDRLKKEILPGGILYRGG